MSRSAVSVEQRTAQLVLQFAEGHAHRRLGEVQLFARPGDLLGLSDGNENFKLSESNRHTFLVSVGLNGLMIEIEKAPLNYHSVKIGQRLSR